MAHQAHALDAATFAPCHIEARVKFKIHVERSDKQMTVEDTFVIEGGSIEEIQEKANAWLHERHLMDANVWSEEL